ncbi:MAG: hypothetical protein NC254_03185 [bacterium]|nr:hypothetical protein [bacterium]
MRSRNAVVNTLAGGLGTLLVGLLQFIGRVVFIRFLSDEYLGISSLFTNILSILSLTELGLSTAVCFRLYQPLAGGDRETVKSVMRYFRRAYFVIGWVVVVLGAALLPFLPWLMTGTTGLVDVRVIYMLYVLQSAASYWFWAYKAILLQADQKLYIVRFYHVLANVIVTVLQLVTLAMFRNFMLYSVIGLFAAVLVNLFSAREVDRRYPYLKERTYRRLTKEEKKSLFRDVSGMSLFKMNTTVVNSTDNLVISAFINVKTVALYGNYQLIISGVSQVAMQLFGGVTATVGNYYAEDTREHNEFVFRCIQLLCYWVYTLLGIGMFVCLNPLIRLCFGTSRVFSWELVFLQVLYFMINGFQRTSFIYRDACGLFWKGKARPVATAVLNIVISIVLVRYIGLAGVIAGTIISWLLTTWWYDPCLIYRQAFSMPVRRYFLGYAKAALLTAALFALIVWLSGLLPFGGIGALAVKVLFCMSIPNVGYYLAYRNSEEFAYLKKLGFAMIGQLRSKK